MAGPALIRFLDLAWEAAPDQRDAIRELVEQVLGHAPDPAPSWEAIASSLPQSKPCCGSESALRLSCDVHEGGRFTVSYSNRLLSIRRLLRGHCLRREKKLLADALVCMSASLRVRTRLVPKLAIVLLSGRADLLPYAEMLCDAMGLGSGTFCTLVQAVTHYGVHPVLSLLAERRIFSMCHVRIGAALAEFAIMARVGCSDGPLSAEDLFEWQYVKQLLGRYDHPIFVDAADMYGRNDPDALRVDNGLASQAERFTKYMRAEIKKEAARFGEIAVQSYRSRRDRLILPHLSALTQVPTGSVGAAYCKGPAAAEVGSSNLNKKLATAYLSNARFWEILRNECHSFSDWLTKTELGKERNLVPGSFGFYLASTVLSAHGEAAFLASLDDSVIQMSDATAGHVLERLVGRADLGYVADRDFKNFNICLVHSDIRMFYNEVGDTALMMGASELADVAYHVGEAVRHVGVLKDGKRINWLYGLQTGWRHTMLLNTLFNVCSGRAVARVVEEDGLGVRRAGLHVGDDSAEVYDRPLAGPYAQAILDAAGMVGQAGKQHFARSFGSWTEFLRIRYSTGRQRGAALRALCSFVSVDAQHAPLEGGHSQVSAIADGWNTIWRRSGGTTCLRVSDAEAIVAYWNLCNCDYRGGVTANWRRHLSTAGSSGLQFLAFPTLAWTGKLRTKRVLRHPETVGPVLLRRATRNLFSEAVAGAHVYNREYADDLMMSALQVSDVDNGSAVGPPLDVSELTEAERVDVAYGARMIADSITSHALVPRDEMAEAAEAVCGLHFAGSSSVASAFAKAGGRVFGRMSDRVRNVTGLGMDILSGKTRVVKMPEFGYAPFPSEWWGHARRLTDGAYASGRMMWLVARASVAHLLAAGMWM